MRKTIVMLSACLTLSVPAFAEPQTYTDDYISFTYDDESDCKIYHMVSEKSISYAVYPYTDGDDGYWASAVFKKDKEYIDSFMKASEDDNVTYEPIDGTENKRRATSTYNDIVDVAIQELAYVDGEKSVTVTASENIDDGSSCAEICKIFVDSVKFFDFDDFPGLDEDEKKYGTVELIYAKKHYSEQTIKYAKKALDTCQQYLDMEITGEEAADVFSDIERRTKDNEGDDKDIYWAVVVKGYTLKYGSDKDVYEIMEELQSIIDN